MDKNKTEDVDKNEDIDNDMDNEQEQEQKRQLGDLPALESLTAWAEGNNKR